MENKDYPNINLNQSKIYFWAAKFALVDCKSNLRPILAADTLIETHFTIDESIFSEDDKLGNV